MKTNKILEALENASKNAEKAFDAINSPEFSSAHQDDKNVWAMSNLINCDICRLVASYDQCQVGGVARLLHLGDIAAKLYEARNWYNNTGTKILLNIAKRKGLDVKDIKKQIDVIIRNHKIHNVNKLKVYRDKFGSHYDIEAINNIHLFGSENSDLFFQLLTDFVKFSHDWAKLTKELIQHPNNATA